jgi:hypothetical protein
MEVANHNALIAELRDQADVIGPGTECNLLRTAADVIESMDERMAIMGEDPAWIPVGDGLPEKGRMVLAAVCGHDVIHQMDGESLEDAIRRTRREVRYVTTGYLDEDGFWNGPDGFPMVVYPSCWMPLPEPPEVEDDVRDGN